ncbi:MAG: serpin family protein [bacterium]|nr:serpin family protein [bacterium]
MRNISPPILDSKYSIKSKNDILKALGMTVAFDPYQADFTRMYKEEKFLENLYISKVKLSAAKPQPTLSALSA